MPGRRPVIFLSHNRRDKNVVRNLREKLKADGVDVWLDEIEIRVGESIHQKVNEGLSKSDFFAIVLSQASVKSKWVQEELSSASSMEKYQKKGIFILPILIESCDVPPLLLDRRYANFVEDEDAAYAELLDSIFHHFGTLHPEVAIPPEASALTLDLHKLEYVRRDASVLHSLSPRAFEELVAGLISRMGYQVELTSVSRDGGKDIIAMKQGLPGTKPEVIFVECKRTKQPVSVQAVREMYGLLASEGKAKGIIVTTSYFTGAAKDFAAKVPIDLVDFEALKDWLKRNHENAS